MSEKLFHKSAMKLVICILCVALTNANPTNIVFEKPRDPVHPYRFPQIFPVRSKNYPRYPLAVEGVLSVALKLQAIEDHGGKQENFLVSPLAVAGALGQLMLGARGELKKQIGVLLTLQSQAGNDIPNRSAVSNQPHIANNPATTVQQRIANPVFQRPINGSGDVVTRFGTVTAQDAGVYQGQRAEMPFLPARGRDGLPGLELHRQLGQLIRDLSLPLPGPGTVHPISNSSYLHTSSAFFLDHHMNLSEPFVRAIIDFYDSKVVPLNFRDNPVEAQKRINDWGSTETGGLINQFLVYPPPLDTAVIQAVAVHFRGAWQTPFIPEGTIPGYFQTSENTGVPVKYMRGTFEQAFYAEDPNLGLRLLAMPYSNFDCAMYVVLPMNNHTLKFNIGHLVTQLTSRNLADLVGMAKKRTVNVMFPRLSLTGSLRLGSALEKHAAYLNKQKANKKANGSLNSAVPRSASVSDSASTSSERPEFPAPHIAVDHQSSTNTSSVLQRTADPLRVIPLDLTQSGAENIQIISRNDPSVTEGEESSALPLLTLTGAAADSKFRVSDIIQQIALEVTEAGTEAAAIAGSTTNYSGDVKNFQVKRPFLFFIRHEDSNALLFWGTVVDPTA